MTDASAPRDRLEALEIHAAHQARVIEDLHAAVAAQWTAIDLLNRRFAIVVDRLDEAESRAGTLPPAAKPPHY